MDLNLAEFLKIPSQPEKGESKVYDARGPLTSKKAIELLMEGKLGSKVCKFCLNLEPNMYEMGQIFEIAGKKGSCRVTVRDMVGSIYPFEILNEKELPQSICNKCLNRTISSYLFAQQIDRSERALQNFIEDMNNKFDKLDPLDRPKKRGRQKINPNSDTLYAACEFVYDYADPQMCLINRGNDLKKDTINQLECPKCWRQFSSIELRMSHEIIHPASMWYCCRICGYSFPKYQGYRRHIRETHDAPVVIKNPTLACQCKCGNITGNYSEHLQHIEKHKFRTIMESMISGKMDKLCVICMGKEHGMVGLDMKLRLHGGYPEITGDRTLQSILNTTLPDQNQLKANRRELTVLNVAKRMRLTWDRVKRKRQLEETKENNAPSDYTFSNPIIISDMIVNKDSNVNAGSNTAGGDQVNTNTYTSGHIPEDNNNNIPELNANSDIIDNGHQTQSRKRKHEEDTVQAALIEAVNLEAATEIVEIENEKNNPQTVEGSEFIVNIDNTNAADNLSETREESIKSDVNAVDCAKEKEVSGIPEIVEKSESLKVLRSANSESVVFDNMYEANTKAIQINLDVPKETTVKENIRPSKDAETQTDEGSVAPKQVVNEKAIQTELCKVDEKGVQVDKDIVIEKIETGAYNEMEIDDFVESSKTIAEPATYTSQNSNSNIPNFNANFNSNCMFNANKVSENSATIAAAPKPQVSFAFETVSVNTQIPPINTPFTFGSDNKIASINAPKVQTPFTFGSNNKITPVNTPKTPAAFTFGSDNKIGSIQAPFVFGSGSKVAPINTPKVQTPFTFGSDKIAPINAPKTQATFTFDSGNKFFGNNVPTAQAQFTIGSDNTPKAQSQFTIGSGNKYDQFQNSRRVIKAKRRR